ncbi:GNAT family N-acetyltransferase [soil metagenome]
MLTAPEPLSRDHEVAGFSCGEASLDDWLRRRARANQVSGATRTFVVQDRNAVVSYYALASSAVAVASAVGRFKRNMPDPIPVVVLARLAVAESHHRRGIGRALFQDAGRRVLHAADSVGIRSLIVHALSDAAVAFYRRLGLEPSPLDPRTLMVTMADLRATLK